MNAESPSNISSPTKQASNPKYTTIEGLLQCHMEHAYALNVYMTILMDRGRHRSAEDILKCVPVNMFDEFKEYVADSIPLPETENPDEPVLTFGGKVDWTPRDALRIHTWLQEHPNPELGPHDGWDYSLDRSIIQKRWEKFPHLKPPGRSD